MIKATYKRKYLNYVYGFRGLKSMTIEQRQGIQEEKRVHTLICNQEAERSPEMVF